MTSLSAIVPATNEPPTLERCLVALRRSCGPDDEVLVVDDVTRGNLASVRNRGAARAAGGVLVFVDADVEVHPEALTRIRAAFDADSELVAIFGSYDDEPSEPGIVSGFRNLLHHHVHQSSPGEATTFWTGLGAIRRDAFEQVGGFDESVSFMEDVDLGMRLAAGSARIVLDPDILGTHLKAWSLWSMVHTDFARRGVPWVRLLLSHRHSNNVLNLSWKHRLSAAASVAGLAGLVARRPRVVVAASFLLVGLNHEFLALLAQRRGRSHAVAGVPLLALHHAAGVASLPVGAVMHMLKARKRARG